MPPPLQPEFFLLLGIDLFLAMSLITCLLDKHLPWQLPYLCQLASLAGFGQLLISKEFSGMFSDYMRFWYSFAYAVIALASMLAVTVYLGMAKKLLNHARVLMLTTAFPAIAIMAFFVSNYAETVTYPLLMVPQTSWETTFIGIVSFDIFVVGVGTYVFFKPKWWYIAIGAGTGITATSIYAYFKPSWGQATFVVSAVGLAIACVIVLGVSIYVLTRIWLDTLKHKKRKKGGETGK